jgi:CO/xanthine dehydrogenase FAD-binding subunit
MLKDPFTYETPDSIESAFQDRMRRDKALFLAGGSDLIPLMKYGVKNPSCLVDLKRISPLQSITLRPEGLFIGSMVTLTGLTRHPVIRQAFPSLIECASRVASPQIRNQATLGGNLLQEKRCLYFNQSEFWRKNIAPCIKLGGEVCHQAPRAKTCRALYYSDTAPVLLSLDAKAERYDGGGFKTVPLPDLLYEHNAGRNPFLLTGVLLPLPPEGTWCKFLKWSVRGAVDFATVNLAIRYSPASGTNQPSPVIKICAGAVAPEPVMLDETAGNLISNLPIGPSAKEEMNARALKELGAKSALIRETGISLHAKRSAFLIVHEALDAWFTFCSGPVFPG